MNPFFRMLEQRWEKGARVCIGLDSAIDRMPDYGDIWQKPQSYFNERIIEATKDLALCYKPNIAFYSDVSGLSTLIETIATIRELAPDVPIILDSKRADIGNTNKGYVNEAFEVVGADAVTVNPFFGQEALKPFLERTDKGVIILCRTSNPGAAEFQNIRVWPPKTMRGSYGSTSLYKHIAMQVADSWNTHGNCALVVGATAPTELKEVREIVGDMWLLIPGIGTQGGDVEAVVANGINSQRAGMLINSSSSIIFSPDPRAATVKLTNEINAALAKIVKPVL